MTARNPSILNYPPVVAAADLLVLQGCSWLYLELLGNVRAAEYMPAWWHLLPVRAVGALLIFWGFGLYRVWTRRPVADLTIFISVACALSGAVWMVLCRWEPQCLIPRRTIAAITVMQVVVILMERMLMRGIIHRREKRFQTAIVASDHARAESVRLKLLSSAPVWLSVSTCLTVQELQMLADEDIVWQTILLTQDVEDRSCIVRRTSRLGKEVLLIPSDFEIFLNGGRLQSVDDLLMVALTPPSLHLAQRIVKRGMDIAGAITLLALASPLMAAVAILIRFTSPGEVLFTQKRVGRGGREFTIYKFRTMVADAERQTGPVLATAHDPRITPLGALLRAMRLDELPQLFNVLRGDMSLVGPRPERPHFVRQFQEQLPGYEFRLAVKPGVTGLAQVRGSYSTTAQRKLRFDLTYIGNYSLLLDIRILLSTVAVLLRREQSQGIRIAEEASGSEAVN